MFINIRALGFDLSDALGRHVKARLEHALEPFARRIVVVTARLEDVNGDHGGIDKRCRVVVTLRRGIVIVAEATDEDLYIAVDKVATRVRRSVKRVVTRRNHRERNDRQRPGALVTI